jgi:hypothetical protein
MRARQSAPTSLLPITAALLAALAPVLAARPGNLLHNGSFEVGLQNWACYVRGTDYPADVGISLADPQPTWAQAKNAPHGRRVLRLQLPPRSAFVISSRAYELAGGALVFSLWVRSSLPVQVRLVDAARASDNVLAELSGGPAAAWTRLVRTLSLPAGVTQVAVAISGRGPGWLELDDVRLAPPSAAPPPSPDLAVAVEPGQVLTLGQTPKIVARLFAPRPSPAALLHFWVEDAWGQELQRGKLTVRLPQNSLVQRPLPLTLPGTGLYHLFAQVQDQSGARSEIAETLVAVVPRRSLPTSSQDAQTSRFGCNMESRPWLVRLAQLLGLRWVFCSPPLFTKWFSAEPRPGEWRFYDEVVALFERAGLRLVGNLADPPLWATQPGTDAYSGPWPNPRFPTDWRTWDEYVRQVVTHYRPYITHWGLWNEPNHPGYLALAEGENWVDRYLDLLRRTFALLKAVDPQLKLVGGTVTHPGALEPLLQAGALDHMDIAAFHWASWSPQGYLRNTVEEMGVLGPKEAVNCIGRLIDIFAARGKRLPLWDTECHMTEADVEREFKTQPEPPKLYETPRMTALDAANAVVRCFVGEWAAGVDKTFYWLLADAEKAWEPRTAKTLTEWDRSPTAALVALAVLTDQLADAQFLQWQRQSGSPLPPGTDIWLFRFRKPGGRVTVLWSNRDEETELTLPVSANGVKVWDLFGRELRGVRSMSAVPLHGRILLRLTRSPVYVFEPQP